LWLLKTSNGCREVFRLITARFTYGNKVLIFPVDNIFKRF
jgi:hypothetical protein